MKLKPITIKTLCALSLSLAMPAAFAGNITDINVSSLPDNQKIIKIKFDKDATMRDSYVFNIIVSSSLGLLQQTTRKTVKACFFQMLTCMAETSYSTVNSLIIISYLSSLIAIFHLILTIYFY